MSRAARLSLMALLAWVFAAWLFQSGTFAHDDREAVFENPLVARPGWLAIFAADYWQHVGSVGIYRPLTTLSLAADHVLFGEHPAGYHFTNLLLAALVAWAGGLLGFVLAGVAGAAGGLFLLFHPVAAEQQFWISGRTGLLSLLFTLCAGLAGASGRRGAWLLLPALLAKEDGILAAPVFLLAAARGRRPRGELLVLAACAAVYLALRWNALGSLVPPPRGTFFRDADLVERLLRAGQLAVRHAGLLLLLESPVPSYRGDPAFSAAPGLAGAAGLAGLVLLAAWGALQARRGALGGRLASWAVLAFIPTSHLVRAGDPLAARFVHGAVLPLALLAVLGARRLAGERLALGLALALGLGLALPHARVAAAYRDAGSAWEAVLARFPDHAPARLMCALAKEDRGDLAGAADDLRRLALEQPEFPRARVNLARILAELGDVDEALVLLEEADREPTAGDRGALLRGRLLLGRGRLAEADAAFAVALRRNPRNGQAARYRVRVAIEAGDHERAARLLEAAQAIDPRHESLAGLRRKILR